MTAAGSVLIAPDKFKGSLSAIEVAEAVGRGLSAYAPVRLLPVADGGEGTIDAAVAAGFRRVRALVAGPTGQWITAFLAVRGDTAVVELAEASGLSRLPGGRPAPLSACSRGTGQLIAAALGAGRRRVVLGVGGSACTDGGAGMLAALGARLLDSRGRDLPPGGAALANLARLDLSDVDARLSEVALDLATDVDNPLLGPNGAAAVYGPQKGAHRKDVEVLERGLRRWSEVVSRELGVDLVESPGAGAAGGVGFAAMAVLGARRRPGIQVLTELLGFDEAVRDARLVITGEGSLDSQTLRGKAPAGVAQAAAGRPVVAVAGRCTLTSEQLREAGFAAVYPLSELEPDRDLSIEHAAKLLERQGARIAEDFLR